MGMENVYGCCPVCGANDGYLDVGEEQWFYCSAHKKRWLFVFGSFSAAHRATESGASGQLWETMAIVDSLAGPKGATGPVGPAGGREPSADCERQGAEEQKAGEGDRTSERSNRCFGGRGRAAIAVVVSG